MSSTLVLEPGQAPPQLGLPFEQRLRQRTTPERALAHSHLPLIMSGLVNMAFFVVYWVPELRGFPGGDFLLSRLSPLASKELTSHGRAIVATQIGHNGLGAAYLLIAAVALPVLARARFWLARLALLAVVVVALPVSLGIVVGAVGRGLLADTLLGLLLIGVWVVTAVTTAWRSLGVDPTRLPLRPVAALWVLLAYALITPAPVAVGRSLFGRELRAAALEVADGGFSVRWAALISPTTLPIYAVGLLVGILIALAYVLVPPRWPRVPVLPLLVGALVAFILLVLTGVAGVSASQQRVEQIRTASPLGDLPYFCAAWTVQAADEAVQTLVVSGTTCQRLRAYAGYREVAPGKLPDSMSPIRAAPPGGGKQISTDQISGRYAGIVVIAVTSRFDNQATELAAVRIADASVAWTYDCPNRQALNVRLYGSDDPPDPTQGRAPAGKDGPSVAVSCGTTPRDWRTRPRRRRGSTPRPASRRADRTPIPPGANRCSRARPLDDRPQPAVTDGDRDGALAVRTQERHAERPRQRDRPWRWVAVAVVLPHAGHRERGVRGAEEVVVLMRGPVVRDFQDVGPQIHAGGEQGLLRPRARCRR